MMTAAQCQELANHYKSLSQLSGISPDRAFFVSNERQSTFFFAPPIPPINPQVCELASQPFALFRAQKGRLSGRRPLYGFTTASAVQRGGLQGYRTPASPRQRTRRPRAAICRAIIAAAHAS